LRWLSSVTMFVACQGCTPWFEARVGHLTGTTALQTLKTIKFVLLDDSNSPPSVRILLCLLGLSLERKSKQQICSFPESNIKKAYKSLGFHATASTPRDEVVQILEKQHQVHHWCFKS
jgi:hypothetical protein